MKLIFGRIIAIALVGWLYALFVRLYWFLAGGNPHPYDFHGIFLSYAYPAIVIFVWSMPSTIKGSIQRLLYGNHILVPLWFKHFITLGFLMPLLCNFVSQTFASKGNVHDLLVTYKYISLYFTLVLLAVYYALTRIIFAIEDLGLKKGSIKIEIEVKE